MRLSDLVARTPAASDARDETGLSVRARDRSPRSDRPVGCNCGLDLSAPGTAYNGKADTHMTDWPCVHRRGRTSGGDLGHGGEPGSSVVAGPEEPAPPEVADPQSSCARKVSASLQCESVTANPERNSQPVCNAASVAVLSSRLSTKIHGHKQKAPAGLPPGQRWDLARPVRDLVRSRVCDGPATA
jgi:hypothetical protein